MTPRARRLGFDLVYLEGLTKEQIRSILTAENVSPTVNLYAFGDKLLVEFEQESIDRQIIEVTARLLSNKASSLDLSSESEEIFDRQGIAKELPRSHRIRFTLDGEDLDELLGNGQDFNAVKTTLEKGEFRVEEIAFAPGFLYLSGLPPSMHLPRRATPRANIRPRSLAIGGHYLGVYPLASPGGWNVIGTILDKIEDLVLSGAIARGDKVEWVFEDSFNAESTHVHNQQFGESKYFDGDEESPIGRLKDVIHPNPYQEAPFAKVNAIEGNVTIQGGYRNHLGSVAISRSGPVDPVLLEVANCAVGNSKEAPALEIPLGSTVQLTVNGDGHVIYTGQEGDLSLDGRRIPTLCVVPVRMGETIIATNRLGGKRSYEYLAIGGGIAARNLTIGGVSSYDVLSKIGQRIEVGTLLARRSRVGKLRSNIFAVTVAPTNFQEPSPPDDPLVKALKDNSSPFATSKPRNDCRKQATGIEATHKVALSVPLRLSIGPDEVCFAEEDLQRIDFSKFVVTSRKSRVGQHIEITPKILPIKALDNSHPIAAGALQINPDGDGFVIGRDHPVSGGYPVIGYFSKGALSSIMQMPPGTSFCICSHLAKDIDFEVEEFRAETLVKIGTNSIATETVFNPKCECTKSATRSIYPEVFESADGTRYRVAGYLPTEEQLIV